MCVEGVVSTIRPLHSGIGTCAVRDGVEAILANEIRAYSVECSKGGLAWAGGLEQSVGERGHITSVELKPLEEQQCGYAVSDHICVEVGEVCPVLVGSKIISLHALLADMGVCV